MQFVVVKERCPSGTPVATFEQMRLDIDSIERILRYLSLIPAEVEIDSLRIKEYDYDCWSVCNEDESISYLIFPDPNARSFAGW